MKKLLLLALMCTVISLSLVGCEKHSGAEHPSHDHPKSDHPE